MRGSSKRKSLAIGETAAVHEPIMKTGEVSCFAKAFFSLIDVALLIDRFFWLDSGGAVRGEMLEPFSTKHRETQGLTAKNDWCVESGPSSRKNATPSE